MRGTMHLRRRGLSEAVVQVGDRRFDPWFARIRDAPDRVAAMQLLSDEEVIAALGGATQREDLMLSNVLATEAQNRARRARELSAALGEGVLVMSHGWRITMLNPAAERMLGWRSDECVGNDPHEILHPFCTTRDACHLGHAPVPDSFYQDDEGLVMRKDGRTIRVAYTVTPMLHDGLVNGGVVILRDSSERKRQEEKEGERQDRLLTILETLSEGILTMDLEGRITYANAAATRILGRAARDIMQRSYFDPAWSFTTPEGEVAPIPSLPFLTVISTHAPILGARLGVERGDGARVQLVLNTVPLPDANGVPYAILVSFQEAPRTEAGL